MKAYGGDSDSDNELADVDVDKLGPVEVSPDEHRLQYTYCLWYHKGNKVKAAVCSATFMSPVSMGAAMISNVLFFVEHRTTVNHCT